MSKSLLLNALIFILLCTSGEGMAQDNCQVLLEKIAEKYSGDCKKKKAHGIGVAIGEDKYEGEFRKGWPEGSGTYTWSSGDIFKGNFKRGKRNGKGTLTHANGDVVKGYWAEDIYLGQYQYTHKLLGSSLDVSKVNFKRESQGNTIVITSLTLGKRQPNPDFQIEVKEGAYLRTEKKSDSYRLLGVQYPFNAEIRFPNQNKYFIVHITQEGHWDISVDCRPNFR